jgi:hypothetical protein
MSVTMADLIECDVCALVLSFSDYASHIETHVQELYLMSVIEGEDEELEEEEENTYELNLLMQELMGKVELGVTNIDTALADIDTTGTEIECPICLQTHQKNVKKTPCNHLFCGHCITKWLSKNKACPICMSDIQMLSTASSSSMNATSSSARCSEVPDV